MKITIGITGASGAIYAKRLLEYIAQDKQVEKIALIYSQTALKVWQHELNEEIFSHKKITLYDNQDYFSPVASGSAKYDAMVVVPCSMGTMGKIANSIADNLISRAADVMLKENRRLVIVPRETPYNLIHLKNMEKLILAGAHIIPASPSFYSRPENINQLVDTVIYKILDHIGLENNFLGWGEEF